MDDREIVAKEEHPGPGSQEDGKAGLKTFEVYFETTTPGTATIRARDAEEALQKFRRGEVEEYDDDEFDSRTKVTGLAEVSK